MCVCVCVCVCVCELGGGIDGCMCLNTLTDLAQESSSACDLI